MMVDGAETTEGSMLQIAEQMQDYVEKNFIKVISGFNVLINFSIFSTLHFHCKYATIIFPLGDHLL